MCGLTASGEIFAPNPPCRPTQHFSAFLENSRKRGVEFKGGSLHDGFGGFDSFGGSGEHLALFLLVLQNSGQRGNRDGFDGFGGYGGFGRDGYPP